MISNEKIIVKRRLIIGLAIQITTFLLIMPIIQILSIHYNWPHHVLGMVGVCMSILTTVIFVTAYQSILGRQSEIYKGLSSREQELNEKLTLLQRDNEVFKQLAGFKTLVYSKITFIVNIILFFILMYGTAFMYAENGAITPGIHFYFMYILLIFSVIFSIITNSRIIFKKASIEICHCSKVNIGTNEIPNWVSIVDCGYFSTGLCPDCRNFIMRTYNKAILLGNLLCSAGLITQDVLDKALEKQRTLRTKKLGTILIEMGAITESEIRNVVLQQNTKEISHEHT